MPRFKNPTDRHYELEITDILELIGNNGKKHVYKRLDTIEYKNDKYVFLTQYETETNVFVIKEVVSSTSGELMREWVEDEELLQTLYDLYNEKHDKEFEFKDN